jgi:hypothetical protein
MGFFSRIRSAGAVACLLGASLALSAQEAKTVLVEPPAPLLTKHFNGWDRQGDAVAGTDPSAADSPNAAVLKEDGLTRFATATYQPEAGSSGKGTLNATAMQFIDATGAYSAYTFYRSQMHHARALTGEAKLGTEAVADGDITLALAGTVVLQVRGAAPAKELLSLSSSLPKVGGTKGQPPLLPSYAPLKGMIPGSVRYALGPEGYRKMGAVVDPGIIAFDKAAETLTAEYAARNGHGVLTLLIYPTPQIAGEQGRAVEKYMNERPIAGLRGALKMKRIGPMIGLATGGFSPEQANEIIEGLHLNQQVAFDKKMPLEFHAEMRKTYSLLQNIAFFSGVTAGAAILLGLFLGGARAGWRVMHGKSAASEPEFLTIDLRDRPKALFGTPPAPAQESKTEA